MVYMEGVDRGGSRGDRQFRFEARWLQEEGCEGIIKQAWDRGVQEGRMGVAGALVCVAGDVTKWSKDVVGELEGRIKAVRSKLDKCMKSPVSEAKVREEADLRIAIAQLKEKKYIKMKQRAHTWWLWGGNKNIKYLQSVASARKRANRLKEIWREDGSVVKEGPALTNYVCSFFQDLFTTANPHRLAELLHKVEPWVSTAMNTALLAEYTREEVKAALDHIGDLKAPGPDGMPAIVFKRHWHFMGDEIVEEVLKVLHGGDFPKGWNNTTLVLIPKVKNPKRIKDLRPISLCNVLYKLVSKVIANRLKIILPEVISENQSAFVPGRLITDNVLIAYEVSHYLMNKRNGRNGVAAVKADMSKAYDRVEWTFLEAMLSKLGFGTRWIALVMKCVTTVRYQIKINGTLTHQFRPSRGLRQGDPISPYLFVICAEGLSALLRHAEEQGILHGVKICPRAPCVSHLLFANDSMLLIRAQQQEAAALHGILQLYEACSGQCINTEKSAIMFSPNTSDPERTLVKDELEIHSEHWSEKYLGLPVHVGRSRKQAFKYIKRNMCGRVNGWQEKLLAKESKEALVKAVGQAIPTYAMSCFDLTKSFCAELNALLGKFWWSQQDKQNPFTTGISYFAYTKIICRQLIVGEDGKGYFAVIDLTAKNN
uniref:Reverse transcriptase domain-containing protein n=1 Tax=Hordeum vulgare subsp. vulgare TaxID=112509 RepID=A0A8I7BB66_HORVV